MVLGLAKFADIEKFKLEDNMIKEPASIGYLLRYGSKLRFGLFSFVAW